MNACIVKRGENHHDANEHPDRGRVLGGAGEALADFLARRPARGRDALSGARQGPAGRRRAVGPSPRRGSGRGPGVPQPGLDQGLHLSGRRGARADRKSTRLNSSHGYISYAVFCLKKKKTYVTGKRLYLSKKASLISIKDQLAAVPV